MASIGFLHTSPVHVPTFERLVAELLPGTEVVSVVDELLLERARAVGPEHLEVLGALADRLAALATVDTVICTCSTIGATAEWVGDEAGVRVVRVDRAMAERAVAVGDRIVVLAAVESTLEPTLALLAEAADQLGRAPEVSARLVAGAWERFEADDLDGYLAEIVAAIEETASDCDVIVLAQASMAPAADRVDVGVPVLSSPRLAIESLA